MPDDVTPESLATSPTPARSRRQRRSTVVAIVGSILLHGVALAAAFPWLTSRLGPTMHFAPSSGGGEATMDISSASPPVESTLMPPDVAPGDSLTDATTAAAVDAAVDAAARSIDDAPPRLADTGVPYTDAPRLFGVDRPLLIGGPRVAPAPPVKAGKTKGGSVAPGGTSGQRSYPVAASGNRPPDYPSECRRKKQTGTAVLTLSIAADGSVASAVLTTSTGHAKLDAAALAAAARWHFTPATEDGRPFATTVMCPIRFLLKE